MKNYPDAKSDENKMPISHVVLYATYFFLMFFELVLNISGAAQATWRFVLGVAAGAISVAVSSNEGKRIGAPVYGVLWYVMAMLWMASAVFWS